MQLLLQKLNCVATVKLLTLEMISIYCSFSIQQQQNFYVHQLLFGLDFMILAHKRRDSQKMACWSFNHFTTSCCFVLIVYFQAIHSYSFVSRYILCSLLAIEKRNLAIYIKIPKICVSLEAFSQLPFTLMAVENDLSTMDESQSGNNHE